MEQGRLDKVPEPAEGRVQVEAAVAVVWAAAGGAAAASQRVREATAFARAAAR